MKEPPLLGENLNSEDAKSNENALAIMDYDENLSRENSSDKLIATQGPSLMNRFQSDSKLARIDDGMNLKLSNSKLLLSEQKQEMNEDKQHENIVQYTNLYGLNKNDLKKSLGENSVHTEFLSKFGKHDSLRQDKYMNKDLSPEMKEDVSSKNDE